MLTVALIVFSLLYVTPGDPAAMIAGDQASLAISSISASRWGWTNPSWSVSGRGSGNSSMVISAFRYSQSAGSAVDRSTDRADIFTVDPQSCHFSVDRGSAGRAGGLEARQDRRSRFHGRDGALVFLSGVRRRICSGIFLFDTTEMAACSRLFTAIGRYFSFLEHLILPALTLGVSYGAILARTTRLSMLDVLLAGLRPDGRGQGRRTSYCAVRHALKNAAIPIITVIGLGSPP